MDCMDFMRDKPDNYYDLAIVDPPYGININHNMGRRKGQKVSNHKPAVWDKGFSADVTFAQFELAWTSFNTTCKKFDKNPNQLDRIHPTQKPVQLYKWLLKNYAKQGDKILDTHGGSFSSAIACHKGGFDLDICELDEDYFNDAVKRFNLNTVQYKLELL